MNNSDNWFLRKFKELEYDPIYVLEQIMLDFSDRIFNEMKKQKFSVDDLSNRLNVSPDYIESILNGDENEYVSVYMLVRIGLILGIKIQFQFNN